MLLVLLVLSVPAFAAEPIRTVDCMTERILDGDTFSCAVKESGGTFLKIRLYGIDAPEGERRHYKTNTFMKAGQPYGEEATSALTKKLGNLAVSTVKIYAIDKYKRMVGMVFIGDRNINQEMVAEGYAWAYRQYLDAPYKSEFIGLEEQARAKKLGLWKESNPEPPWNFRKRTKIRD